MKILINIDISIKSTGKNLTRLTDKAHLNINEVKYFKRDNSIVLPIKRKNIYKIKKNYSEIDSVIIIKNINKYDIKNLCHNKFNTITILFGLQINNKEIYLSSAEEETGVSLYEITIQCKEIDISLIDKENLSKDFFSIERENT